MIIAKTIAECRAQRAKLGKLGFVPTMGALHAGHVSLMTLASSYAPSVAASIFVNPTQFAPTEDFSKYPRPLDADLQQCQAAGVDLVFLPSPEEIYRAGSPDIVVDLPSLTTVLEGAHRPTHFRGVCQIVAKLFNIVQPNVAVFGQKDFQQLRVISTMVEALDFPIQIIPGPTLREPGGLAMSSRNQYLSADERERAMSINRGLLRAQAELKRGIHDSAGLIAIVAKEITAQGLIIDYVAAVDPITLVPVQNVTAPTIFAVAVRAGKTRLIDNLLIS